MHHVSSLQSLTAKCYPRQRIEEFTVARQASPRAKAGSGTSRATPGRRNAVQARSKATVERILDAASALIVEHGADRVTMTDIAQRAGLALGSLYQYFADRGAIHKALFLRHAAWAKLLLHNLLAPVRTMEDFMAAMEAGFDQYFELHQRDPLVNAIWSIVQTDAELQQLDFEDTMQNARLLQQVALRLLPAGDPGEVLTICALLTQFTLTSARFARAAPPAVQRLAGPVTKQIMRDACARLLRPAGA
jgi:AcrR family transcriptional regulator